MSRKVSTVESETVTMFPIPIQFFTFERPNDCIKVTRKKLAGARFSLKQKSATLISLKLRVSIGYESPITYAEAFYWASNGLISRNELFQIIKIVTTQISFKLRC